MAVLWEEKTEVSRAAEMAAATKALLVAAAKIVGTMAEVAKVAAARAAAQVVALTAVAEMAVGC